MSTDAPARIPSGPDEITPEWLTQALRSTGVATESQVTSVTSDMMAAGQGFAGQLARLEPTYASREEGAPTSIVAKFPSAHPPTRELLNRVGAYQREVRFYEEIAAQVELRTPVCYYSALDPRAGDFILLLEDLSSLRAGDQVSGCTEEEADLAVRNVAKVHVAWWESSRLDTHPWLSLSDADIDAAQQMYAQSYGPFLEALETDLPDEFVEVVRRLEPHVAEIKRELSRPPVTLLHGDFRLDNLLFGRHDSDPSLAVVDWQACRRGRGVGDIAYFMAMSVDGSKRAEIEMDLLHAYHEVLVEGGVRDYSFDRCLHDYRLAILDRVSFIVMVAATLDFASKRGAALVGAVMPRFVSAVLDHQVADLVPA